MCRRGGLTIEPACKLTHAGFAANLIRYADLQIDSKTMIIITFLHESAGKLGRQCGRLSSKTFALN